MQTATPYQEMYEEDLRVRSPLFPLYSVVKSAMAVWPGQKKSDIYQMIQQIFDLTGTPQDTMDWTNPDAWIQERLTGKTKEIAEKTWLGSNKEVNPRHCYGTYMFINKYGLLKENNNGIYELSEYGKRFLQDDTSLVKHLDELEGLPRLLSIIASEQPAKRGTLLPRWTEYLQDHSKYGTKSTVSTTFSHRINNLLDRDLIVRDGNLYSVADAGMKLAVDTGTADEKSKRVLLRSINEFNEKQKETFLAQLLQINPYTFEKLISQLLEAMDYQDVVVTKQSGDKGVDVIAKAQFGITEITELVQVKRTTSTITRPVLDQLRGAAQLHHGIFKGTIITLGKFAKGCKEASAHPGALPVTLIDGDRLFDLMVEHEVGVKKSAVTLIELDEKFISALQGETALAA